MGFFQASTVRDDEVVLAELGYKQELRRVLSWFTNLAFSFTVIGPLTTITGSFGIALGNGGPVAAVWGWILVFIFVMCVVLSLAEICSAYPTSGGLYYWSARLGGRYSAAASWFTGWFNLLGQIASVASIGFTITLFIAAMIMIATEGYYPSNKELLGIYAAVLVLQGAVNTLTVDLLPLMMKVSVFWTVGSVVVLMILVPAIAPKHQSAEFVFKGWFPNSESTGITSPAYVFFMGMVMSQWSFAAYDAPAHVIEETTQAEISGPIGMVGGVVMTFFVGLGYILSLLFSIQDFNTLLPPAALDTATGGLLIPAQIFYDACQARFGTGRIGALCLMVLPLVSANFCGLACVTSSSRMLYAFSRDGAVPFHEKFHYIHPTLRIPIYSVWGAVIVAFFLALPMLESLFAFQAVLSVSVIGLYLSYVSPIFLRMTVGRNDFKPGAFSLGRYSIPIAFVATCWVGVITVIFVLPMVYPIDMKLNFNYASIAVGIVLVAVGTWWVVDARHWFKGPVRQVPETTGTVQKV